MALLGTGFNESQPSESDLVKKGAAQFRDIKSRLKAFLTVLFNLDTGDFKDNVIRAAALVDANPNPEGTWRSVTVSPKGLVTGGTNPEDSFGARIYRWVYLFGSGTDPDGDTITRTLAADDNTNVVAQYSFVTPADIDRIKVRVWAPGGGSPVGNGGGGGGAYCEAVVEVTEGDVFLVWVGQGVETGLGTTPSSGQSKFEFNAFKYLKANGGLKAIDANGISGGTADNAGIPGAIGFSGGKGTTAQGGSSGSGAPASDGNTNYGAGAQAGSQTPKDGLVIVEYWGS